jgi:transposase
MHRKAHRRVHGAEFKARVLVECQRPGASVAAVALAHGLNANLLRKWLQGQGLKRCGLAVPRVATPAAAKSPTKRSEPTTEAAAATVLQFLPIEMDSGGPSARVPKAAARAVEVTGERTIDIALARGDVQLQVRWPASQASACGAWLHVLLMGSR